MVFGEGLTHFITIPQWAKSQLGGTEVGWSVAYSLLLIGILVFSLEGGRRFLKTHWGKLLGSNTDELVYTLK